MYEVNINADPARMLDWDKPLGAQPQPVLDALPRLPGYSVADSPTATGELLYRSLGGLDAKEMASASLRDAGIPGIKYLDGGSRGAGAGSHNYVVFDDKLIDILRRYGLAGLVGGGAVGAGLAQDDPRKRIADAFAEPRT
jgi:hypothetical protein